MKYKKDIPPIKEKESKGDNSFFTHLCQVIGLGITVVSGILVIPRLVEKLSGIFTRYMSAQSKTINDFDDTPVYRSQKIIDKDLEEEK